MSIKNWPGGVVTDIPVEPSGNYEDSAASGVWTLDQVADYVKQDLWPTPGNVDPSKYVEGVFSTYLYAGNDSTQTITNGIDLSGKGGLVWIRARNSVKDNVLSDTERGATKYLESNTTNAETTATAGLTAFNSDGFDLGTNNKFNDLFNYASWTFRKQPKFFDVVTFTFASGSPFTFNHSLDSTPACIIFKRTDNASNWITYHRGLNGNVSPNEWNINLNSTAAQYNEGFEWLTSITSTSVTISTDYFADGGTYVAYLFAHDAGGFGDDEDESIIKCGSYTGNGSTDGPEIDLGWEPQWLMIKRATGSGNWLMIDNMRGMYVGSVDAILYANQSSGESIAGDFVSPTSTGFKVVTTNANANTNAATYIYIAIRRGPMKVPESGTEVFTPIARTGTGANATVSGGQIADAVLIKNRGAVADLFAARLTGTGYMETSSTAAEVAAGTTILQANPWDVMDGVKVGTTSTITNASGNTFINYLFRRAPGFFDVVCDTGTGSTHTVAHNLAAVPELMIRRERSGLANWIVYAGDATDYLRLNATSTTVDTDTVWNDTAPTASVFTVGTVSFINDSATTYITYLFATLAGVSKVGTYTGTGTTQTINCGFTAGARFVLIKRTNSTGSWYVWDSARGIVAGNDPYFFLNSGTAEVTNTDYIDPESTGFEISSTAPAGINASGGTYIFLAIA